MTALTPHEIAYVLRQSIREHDWEEPLACLAPVVRDRDLTHLLDAVAHHRIASFVHLSLRGIDGVDPRAAASLERTYRSGVVHHMGVLADLEDFRRRMARVGIPWLTFKGPVLAETVYARPDLRLYSDLDVLVPRASFAAAIEVLHADGVEVLDRNWDLILEEARGQLHVRLRFGTLADVHWHILTRAGSRSSVRIPVADLIARARTVRMGGEPVATLEPVDSLLHLCVHAAMEGGDRLLWLKDLERTIAATPPDWEVLIDRARQWRVNILVGALLQRARDVAGATVPDEAIRALVPSRAWRAVTATVDRRWPVDQVRRPPAAAMMFTRALRDGAAGSVLATVEHARGRARLRAVRREMQAIDDGSGAPTLAILHARATDGARETFMRRLGDDGARL